MDIAPFIHLTYLSYSTKTTSWRPLTIGHLLENIQYETLQSQHYNFGWQISIPKYSAMPCKEFTQLSSIVTQHTS